MPQPYKLFTIYAREDAQYLVELRGQLRPLEIAGRIKVWSDREINPGVDWEREIVQKLDTADIILILVSAAYYNSAYIHEKEIKYALNRHERGEAKVLPVIVRPCSFLDDPVISRLQVLPTDGKPVTDSRHWLERDHAWLDVVAGVKRTLDSLQQAELKYEQDIVKAKLAAEEKAERERTELENQKREQERIENERITAERHAHEERLRITKEQDAIAAERQKQHESRLADLAAWQQAADANNISSYGTYLARFPQGDLAREARYRIKELRRGKKEYNPRLVIRAILLSGVCWGGIEWFFDQIYFNYIDIPVPYVLMYEGLVASVIYFPVFDLISLSMGVFAIFSATYFLKSKISFLLETVRSFVYFGIKVKGVSSITILILMRLIHNFYGEGFSWSFTFPFLFLSILFGALAGLICGVVVHRKRLW